MTLPNRIIEARTPTPETPASAAPIGIGEVLLIREYYLDISREAGNSVRARLNANKVGQLLDELIERRRKEAQSGEKNYSSH